MESNKKDKMDVTILYLKEKPDLSQIKAIEEFNKIAGKEGCRLNFLDHGTAGPVLSLTINYETASNSRGAGRRRKGLNQEFRMIKVGEVRKMLENKTAEEVAAELGVSRSTLFRRLKDREDSRFF